MSDRFRDWLSEEVSGRGWSYRELARRSGISQSLISRTMNGEVSASADFCIKVAQALDEAPEKMLRLAEILPASDDDPTLVELIDTLQNMTPDQREEALRYLRYLFQKGNDK